MADRHPASVASAAFAMAILVALFATESAGAQYIPSPDSPTTSSNDTTGECSAYRADADGSDPAPHGLYGVPHLSNPVSNGSSEYTYRICDIQAPPEVRPGVRRYGNQSEFNDASSYGWDKNVLARAVTDEDGDVAVWIKAKHPSLGKATAATAWGVRSDGGVLAALQRCEAGPHA